MSWLTNPLTCIIIVIIMSTYQRWFLSSPERLHPVYFDGNGFNIVFPVCERILALIPRELELAYVIHTQLHPQPSEVLLSKVSFSTRYCFQGILT